MLGLRQLGCRIENGKCKEAHITHAVADDDGAAAIACAVEGHTLFKTEKVAMTVMDEYGQVSRAVSTRSRLKNSTKGAALGAAIGCLGGPLGAATGAAVGGYPGKRKDRDARNGRGIPPPWNFPPCLCAGLRDILI